MAAGTGPQGGFLVSSEEYQHPRGVSAAAAPICILPLPHSFRKFNILTSSSKTVLVGDSPREGLVCDFQYLVCVPLPALGPPHLGPLLGSAPSQAPPDPQPHFDLPHPPADAEGTEGRRIRQRQQRHQ